MTESQNLLLGAQHWLGKLGLLAVSVDSMSNNSLGIN